MSPVATESDPNILLRQGERDHPQDGGGGGRRSLFGDVPPPYPSVGFAATFPWRGRMDGCDRAVDRLNRLTGGELAVALSSDEANRAALIEAAAKGGAVDAQLLLGQMRLDGKGVAVDRVAALRWFGRAATAGHPMGMNMVGRCLEQGCGAPADKAAAAAWYEAAAARGLDWGLYNLATLLATGDGVPLDRARALTLFERAAALGHAKSMTMVGSFYEDGWAVAPHRETAAIWYRRGAEGGDFRGQFNHARMLADAGRIDRAIRWLRRLPETAPPSFLDQLRGWLAKRPEAALRDLALDL